MTMTAQDAWSEYRDAVGGSNHDGSYTLPESVHDLGERQVRGWQAVADECNRREGRAASAAMNLARGG